MSLIVAHLCEWAAANADGTWTVVRGGITNWTTSDLPVVFGPGRGSLWVFADIAPGALEAAASEFSLELVLPNGVRSSVIVGRLQVANPTGPTRIAVPIDASVPLHGQCRVVLTIGQRAIELPLDIRAEGKAS
jgi:hypothetical protein